MFGSVIEFESAGTSTFARSKLETATGTQPVSRADREDTACLRVSADSTNLWAGS
jgi:hypothetical protein